MSRTRLANNGARFESGDEALDAPTDIPLIDLTDVEDDDDDLIEIGSVPIVNDNEFQAQSRSKKTTSESVDVDVRFCRLANGTVVKIGNFVELELPSHRNDGGLQSGDFIWIRRIIKNTRTGEVRIKGHRLLRTKYCPRIFKETLNELVMHLPTRQYDNRPASVQGLEEVQLREMIRKREIVVTSKPYPMLSFRDSIIPLYLAGMSARDQKFAIFHEWPLVCRKVWNTTTWPNGKVYGSVIRSFYPSELPPPQPTTRAEEYDAHELPTPSVKNEKNPPTKKTRYTFLDICCGAGGASQGAKDAGLQLLGGLDKDDLAIEAWEENFPEGLPLHMDMHDVISLSRDIIRRVDILWFSISCQAFSPSHTVAGKNDAENIRGIYAVKPAMQRFKPLIVVLENTSGLANMKKNMGYFHILLREMMEAGPGYNVRWEIMNTMDHGVPQHRKRLFIIASRNGVPLPPFSKPTHGPRGSGLQPYVSIADALKPIERLGPRAFSKFHQPEKLTRLNKPVYDPNTKVVPCIQTKGLDISHPSGTRSFTPLELGQFQTLPLDFKFYGSQTQSIKQVGNMVPALPVKNLLLNCARVLEAFHHGLITAGEEIEDLDITLIEKGVEIPELASTPSHYFNLTSSAETAVSLYRYLTTPSLSDATAVEFSSAWATRKVEGRGKSGGMKRAFGRMSLENDSFDDDDETFGRRARRARRAPNDDTPIVIEDSD